MIYLIDTHILIQYVEADTRLSNHVIQLIENENNRILISSSSLWEIAIKLSIGKLKMSISLTELEMFLEARDIEIFSFNFQHLEQILKLPFHHNDPFDRLIISQAMTENIPVISDDSKFSLYDVNVIKALK